MPIELNGNDVIRKIMTDDGVTQAVLAERLGYKGQGTVSQRINTKRMSLERFVSMLNAMGYSVAVGKDDGNGFVPVCMVKEKED